MYLHLKFNTFFCIVENIYLGPLRIADKLFSGENLSEVILSMIVSVTSHRKLKQVFEQVWCVLFEKS